MVPRLHMARAMRNPAERGFTIIELMIVVAIIGILAAVAIPAFTKSARKAKSSEVPALFGEFKAREESFAMERGSYLGACNAAWGGALPDQGCAEGNYWPTPLNTQAQMSISSPVNARWSALRINAGKATVYCQYSVIAGPGGQAGNMGGIGQELFQENPGSVPPRNWFYMMARCDWDGDASANAEYWQRGDLTLLGNNGNTSR